MKLNTSTLLIFLVFGLFCGIMILSLGIGTEFTAVNKIMAPVICNGGKFEATWEYNVAHPGKAIYGSRWVCIDKRTGIINDVSFKTNLIAGTIYGLLIFAAFISSWLWVNRPGNK